jgi:hypothetical protein
VRQLGRESERDEGIPVPVHGRPELRSTLEDRVERQDDVRRRVEWPGGPRVEIDDERVAPGLIPVPVGFQGVQRDAGIDRVGARDGVDDQRHLRRQPEKRPDRAFALQR